MGRKLDWKDQTITGGFGGADKARQYRGKQGEKHIIRVVGGVEEYRVHVVTDVSDKIDAKTGKAQRFNVNCAKTWDEGSSEWVGECLACDREYDVQPRFCAGVLLLGVAKGRSPQFQKIDAANAVYFWDFAPARYRSISDIELELSRAKPPKSLQQVELVVTCEDNGEDFQKLLLQISQGERLTTKEHLEAFKIEAPPLIRACSDAPKPADLARRLKKKKADAPAAGGGEDDDLGLDAEDAPAPKGKAAAARGKPAKAEDDDLDLDGELAEEPAPAPAKAAASGKGAKPVGKVPAAVKTGDTEIDDMLGGLPEDVAAE